jgi:hypothetical protein
MDILKPAIVLMAWTMVMWAWLYATRIPAMNRAKLDPDKLANDPEVTLDRTLPPQVQWKAHNYNHLHEAPTVFYAVTIVLAIIGQGDGLNAQLAWAYVGLRILHSLVQATVNKVMVRFLVFVLSSLVLIALILHAAMALFMA